MKDFLKYTLATVLGVVLVGVLALLLSGVALVAMVAGTESETPVKEQSVMLLDLEGVLVERTDESLWAQVNHKLNGGSGETGLDDVLAAIKKAAEHEDIAGIYLRGGALSAGYASLQEIRAALEAFKKTGKFVVAYADSYNQGSYYLASVADKVLLNPQGVLEWKGLASNILYYKDLLAKVGIEMQVFKVGTYKSAVEPYTSTEMSQPNREQIAAYIGTLWSGMREAVSASRGVGHSALDSLANEMLAFRSAEAAVSGGLADSLIYAGDMKKYINSLLGTDEDEKLNLLNVEDMKGVNRHRPKDKSGHAVAVYYAVGEIHDKLTSGVSGGSIIAGDKVSRDLQKLEEDDDIKAVVLRVNSPGGSAFASEQIWYALKRLKAKKPLIVSMGDYAASGGYYIASIADTIVAQPSTLTGSIGIFGLIPQAEQLAKKVGLTHSTVKTHRFSDFGNLLRPFDSDESALLQAYIERGYDTFLSRCAEGRGCDKETIAKVAEGRVWIGEKALELGLVDVLGGIDTAIELAVNKAGVADGYTLLTYPEQLGAWESLMEGSWSASLKESLMRSSLGEWYAPMNHLRTLSERAPIQTRLPFELHVR